MSKHKKHKQHKRERCAQYLLKCILKDNRKRGYAGTSPLDFTVIQPLPKHGPLTKADLDEAFEMMYRNGTVL